MGLSRVGAWLSLGLRETTKDTLCAAAGMQHAPNEKDVSVDDKHSRGNWWVRIFGPSYG